MNSAPPILYSFRRCPYAIRARLAIRYSGVEVYLREVILKNKPEPMLLASPKGTVPVLILEDGNVIDESRDIMTWALKISDPERWLYNLEEDKQQQINNWIDINDHQFKPILDKYKYAVGHPEHPQEYYRTQAGTYLQSLELSLSQHSFLISENLTLADIATFPFIRQFAFVDQEWFYNTTYTNLIKWLDRLLQSERFTSVMNKYRPWESGDTPFIF